jgi:hypothetical protein
MAAGGVAFLQVVQTIWFLPPYVTMYPIYISYRGYNFLTHLEVGPATGFGQIRFYLNTDSSTTGINVGDTFLINGGAVTWIVD